MFLFILFLNSINNLPTASYVYANANTQRLFTPPMARANNSPQRPTQANNGQCRPMQAHKSQQKPTQANDGP
jgi:hypothetical protein